MLAYANFTELTFKMRLFAEFDLQHTNNAAYVYNGYVPLSCRLIEAALAKTRAIDSKGLEMICFIGGCTRGELAVCRSLFKSCIVLTTDIITGNSLMESLLEA